MSHHFFMIVASYVKYVSIQILLRFQPCNSHPNMMTHHSVMTLSLRVKNFKIDVFGDFSWDIDYNCRAHVFRDVISHIINQW